jgi:alpha-tubulin suppressor-like RCC1 family protein
MSQLRRQVCAWMVRVSAAAVLTLVAGGAQAQTLAGGNNHSIVLKSDGTVWTFGDNCLIHRNVGRCLR